MKKIVIAMNKMLFYVTLLGVIFFTFTTISLLILDIINVMEVFSDGRFLIIVIFTVFVWLVFMFALKSCQTRITFTKEQIEVYQKNQLVRKVNLDEVSMLYYYPFRLHYILTIYAGALSNGGATVLYYQTTDGWVYELGYIGEKDAIELKNHFYPDKMIIHFERKPKKRQTDSPVEEHKAFTPLVFDASHGSGVIENISIINARNIIAQNAIQARFLYLLVILNEMILFILLNQNVIILSLMAKEAIQWMIVAIPFFFLLPLILSILIQKGYDRKKRKRSAYHYYFFETEFEVHIDSDIKSSALRLGYTSLKGVIETKTHLFLFINRQKALYVVKTGFIQGAMDDLYRRLNESGVPYKRYAKIRH